MTHVEFNAINFARFKLAVKDADELGKETFEFEDSVYLVRYAKYLVEYLEPRINGMVLE